MDWIHLAQDKDVSWPLVRMETKLAEVGGNFFLVHCLLE
jgi:hypothetical protein